MVTIARHGTHWVCASGTDKLKARARLPGAFAFDRAAAALRAAAACGLPVSELLPLAFASSWFVNNTVPSPVFRRWLEAPAKDVWTELVATLAEGPSAWAALGDEDRAVILHASRSLADPPHGVGALSKVLALLVPDMVPLMPDAALWFALDTVARPATPDAQAAGVEHLLPMLDWFVRAHDGAAAELDALAQTHAEATLSGAQALDRLIWFDSAGYRHFRAKSGAGWFWVVDGDRQGVVALTSPPPERLSEEPLDLEGAPSPWKDEARRALDGG